MIEGDTPSTLFVLPNGLNDSTHPDFGGWGGRYLLSDLQGDFKHYGDAQDHGPDSNCHSGRHLFGDSEVISKMILPPESSGRLKTLMSLLLLPMTQKVSYLCTSTLQLDLTSHWMFHSHMMSMGIS